MTRPRESNCVCSRDSLVAPHGQAGVNVVTVGYHVASKGLPAHRAILGGWSGTSHSEQG
jgi:hypothetical protein